ncbi:MAG: ABC transporter substrate-binding protein [Cypionkella sp.]
MKLLPLLALILFCTPATAADKLTVMLDWFTNPDHGPIIVAEKMGYFAEAGLDVQIIAPSDPADPPKMVAAGQVDLGLTYQPQLYLQHEAGLPLVRVGTLINSPLYCVLTKADGPVASLADLKGRKVGFSVAGIEEALLYTMLRHNGVAPETVEMVNVNFALTQSLASGQVDAVSGAFRNFEPHQLEALGQPARCFNPEDNGVPGYDELIYVANPQLMNPDRIRRFLTATEKAAAFISANPDKGWDSFASYAPELKDDLNAQAWTDTLPHFAAHPMALDAARYASFGAYMHEVGLIKTVPAVADIAVDLSKP